MSADLLMQTRVGDARCDMTRNELEKCERVIERGKVAFLEVGTALAEIRERRGYRFEFKTFNDYCAARWGWSRQNAALYIGAAEVVKAVPELSSQLDITHGAELSKLREPATQGDKRHRSLNVAAIREVAQSLDFAKTTVKQVAAAVNDKQRELRRLERACAVQARALTVAEKTEPEADPIHCDDGRNLLDYVQPGSIQLIVTSPPYNQGIQYSAHDDAMPEREYWTMLTEVFRECFAALCDGGRIAVVVPDNAPGLDRAQDIARYVPFSPRVLAALAAVGFTPRDKIIWDKGSDSVRSNTGWGSYARCTSPYVRDRHEDILIAHKGSSKLPSPRAFALAENEFERLTQSVWQIAPESAKRVGHPAPFPVPLVENLIRLYAYPGSHIADPFGGSGTTAVAAQKQGCKATMIEKSSNDCALARVRLEQFAGDAC